MFDSQGSKTSIAINKMGMYSPLPSKCPCIFWTCFSFNDILDITFPFYGITMMKKAVTCTIKSTEYKGYIYSDKNNLPSKLWTKILIE